MDAAALSAIKDRPDVLVLDVREQWEYDEAHIPGVTLLPMNSVPNRLSEIPTDKTVVVTVAAATAAVRSSSFCVSRASQMFTI